MYYYHSVTCHYGTLPYH